MKQIHTIAVLFLSVLTVYAQQTTSSNKGRWSEKKANQWFEQNGWLRGCNFIPSTAINQLEMWQDETFDPVTIDRELGYAEFLGFNVMRVFLHHKVWLVDAAGFKKRMDKYLAISTRHHIKTMFVFLDDCHNGTSMIGKQPDPLPGIHNSGWVQDPGLKESVDTTYFPILEKYVKDIMSSFAKDKRIIMWDLYNEPGAGGKNDSSLPLLKHIFSWARDAKVTQPLTSGVWGDIVHLNKYQLANSDIITFHNYSSGTSMREAIDTLRAYLRPILCTEYMARTSGSTFHEILPILKAGKIGAINWGLVWGKTNTIYSWFDATHIDGAEPSIWFHDIFRTDGTPYKQEEVDLIRNLCVYKLR